MWCKVQISGKKTLHIEAYYKPHENDEEALLELEGSLSLVNVNHQILLAGDFNLPGWDWKEHIVKPCNHPSLHYKFGDILDDNNLIQVVELPTRNQNILDLVITNNPNSVKNVSVIPGISDYDCPVVELDLTPVRYKQKPRQIPLCKRAKWDNISEDLLAASVQIQNNTDDKTVNDMWIEFKEAIDKAVKKHIPHRKTKSRDNLPWVTPQIRKLFRNEISCPSGKNGNKRWD